MNTFPIYYRVVIITLLCFCTILTTKAQQVFVVSGTVFKKSSPERITQARITNLKSKTSAVSDELGNFRIQVAKGDTIEIKKPDYMTEKQVIVNGEDIRVNMQPIITLNQVTIKEESKKQEMQYALDEYKRKGQYYSLHPNVMSVLSSPLTGLYELFGKAPADAKRFIKYTKEENERIEVSKRFNRPLVKKHTDISDADMDDFMLAFTPTYDQVKVWSEYDIIKYIKSSYEYFKENKEHIKVQKLY